MPCEIYMGYIHNHSITSLQVLSFRDISQETADKVWKLFDDGLSPGMLFSHWLNSK